MGLRQTIVIVLTALASFSLNSMGVCAGEPDPETAPSSIIVNENPGAEQGNNSAELLNSAKQAPPGTYLQGKVTVLGPGTHFRCVLSNTLDSSYTNVGEQFLATVTEPVVLNGKIAVPAGSTLTGEVTHVVSARAFDFGKNGSIDVRFIAVETPDGRKFPIHASVDVGQMRAAGGVTRSPDSRAVSSAEHGAIKGLAVGGAGGALYGMMKRTKRYGPSRLSNTFRYGAIGGAGGAVIGAGAGLVSAGVKKGSDIHVAAGTSVPVQLDEPLTMSDGDEYGTYPSGQYPAAVQQPYGAQAPQQQNAGYPAANYPQPFQQQPPSDNFPSDLYPEPLPQR